jgi:uncharacterized protein YndB with AHSA1/START domain
MAVEAVNVEYEFRVPVERVFSYLSEHENLAGVFGMRVERLRDGAPQRNGVGSVRRLSLNGIAPFEETVTAYREHQLIEYRITKGTPLNEHHGAMRFSRRESGHASHLEYAIRVGSDVPGVAQVVARVLRRRLSRGLARVDDELVARSQAEGDQTAATTSGSRLGLVEPPAGSDVTST